MRGLSLGSILPAVQNRGQNFLKTARLQQPVRKAASQDLLALGILICKAFRKKTPAGEFMRCPLNLNSNNHNQHDGSPCFYLAVQPSPESSIVFATANVSLCYPNPFRRSLQCEIQHWP
jgi:hypothetical protein